jgi:hypothetical protein
MLSLYNKIPSAMHNLNSSEISQDFDNNSSNINQNRRSGINNIV